MKLALWYMTCFSTILPSRQRGIVNKVKVIKRRAYGLPPSPASATASS
jgi:hypothetical protein